MDHSGVRTLTLTAVTQRDFSLANTKITTADPARVQDLWLRDGDIFVERANTAEMVGLAALYRGRSDFAIFPDLLIRVRVDPDALVSDILMEWLLSPWCRSYFQKHCRGAATSMPKIDHRTVEEVPVPIPRMDEQPPFVRTICALDSRFSAARQRAEFLRLLFSSMLYLLMTGQVRVNGSPAVITIGS
jgi:type I restriction enzyme S subunit